MEGDIRYPYIVFKIAGSLYCLNSKFMSSIVQLPPYEKIPAAPANVTGMFRHDDQVIQMLDLRITFGMKAISEECKEFEAMIDARKHDHIVWVEALEHSIESGEPFKLATNPHMCKLGMWYDNFSTDNNSVSFHLKKIEEPHRKLHEAALEVEKCRQDCDNCRREACFKKILFQVKEESMPTILKLLEETKEAFSSSIFREMVLLLDGMNWGIVVDEIVAVEDLTPIDWREQEQMKGQCTFISNVLESQARDGLIFELNIDALSSNLEELEKQF